MKIYTRIGDSGETSLFNGKRVAKDSPRVAAYGEVDELNAVLGLARSLISDPQISQTLAEIQKDLFSVGAQLADPEFGQKKRSPKFCLQESRIAISNRTLITGKLNWFRSGISSFQVGTKPGPPCTWRGRCAGELNGISSVLVSRSNYRLSCSHI